jgi:hypothetical protein
MATPRERLGGPRMLFLGGPMDGRFLDASKSGRPAPYVAKFKKAEGQQIIEYRYKRARPCAGGFIYEYSSWRVVSS